MRPVLSQGNRPQEWEEKIDTTGRLADFDHPLIAAKAAELTLDRHTVLEELESIFHGVNPLIPQASLHAHGRVL